MKAEFIPSTLCGRVTAPPSKSEAHRAIICACLANGVSRIDNIEFSNDILATINCLRSLGAEIEAGESSLTVTKPVSERESAFLDCGESGSTLRFLIPLAVNLCERCEFTGSGRLMSRPLSVYEEIFDKNGIEYSNDGNLLKVSGKIPSGRYTLSGNISSQFISGLLFALPLAEGDSELIITPPFESKPYVDMTLGTLADFGINAEFKEENKIFIKQGEYKSKDIKVGGDWSNAAFLDAFNLIGGSINVDGLDPESVQGDKVYKDIFEKLQNEKAKIDLSDYPDLGPVCMALAYKNGAVFTGTKRLRIKESDRAAAMAQELAKFGIKTDESEDTFTVCPSEIHAPSSPLDSHNDHRIVMALSVLCTLTGGVIDGADAVSKSFPSFFENIKSLGAQVKLYETA
ncbi:MAG: 3-phosphoshikimate 1-carboxyvinyltransferase [Clostridia bacterium]|nr:3-phosphoshikimate 1-carboxyvinyltransferase [Clostridia bacterium]